MRQPHSALIERLYKEPYKFEFFQAVRLLEQADPDRAAVGYLEALPSSEVVRFVQHVSLSFPASQIQHLGQPGVVDETAPQVDQQPGPERPDLPPRMKVSFIGLVGRSGVLPQWVTQELIAPTQSKNDNHKTGRPFLEFLNLFHHRVTSLFFRAWEKYRVVEGWDRRQFKLKSAAENPQRETGSVSGSRAHAGRDPFSEALRHLVGQGFEETLRSHPTLGDDRLLFYTGLFSQRHRSAAGLEALIRHRFELPVTVVPFYGQWLRLHPSQQTRLGRRDGFSLLGKDTVVGDRCWDDASLAEVQIGPLSLKQYRELLPVKPKAQSMTELIRLYLPAEVRFRRRLVLGGEEVPPAQLTRDQDSIQLGRVAWLGRRPPVDAHDALLRPGC